jgi:predicted dehydrogenase/threonine dehydrogenase-like Zn-dependent dehydrogenase
LKQVVAKAGKVEVIGVPAPMVGDNEVLVRTAFSLISSGTESWTIEATEPISAGELVADRSKLTKGIGLAKRVWDEEGFSGLTDYIRSVRNPQVPLGYSLSGTVIGVGKNVKDIVVGDRVACAGEGKACHAELVSVPRNLMTKVPSAVDLQDAAFTTVGAISVHGFRRSGARVGDAIAVLGAGLVGNLTIQICKAAGCRVVALDLREDRLELARLTGADLILSIDDSSLFDRVSNFTEGRGVDQVLICAATSKSDPVNLASKIARDRATVTVIGRVGMDLERKDYYQKELEIQMSRSLGPGRYDPVYEERGVDYPPGYVRWTLNRNMDAFLRLLEQGRVKVGSLVAGMYSIDDAGIAYSTLEKESKVAVLLSYGAAVTPGESARSLLLESRKVIGRINLGLVGPGNFAKEILIPELRHNAAYNLRWVISSNPVHARQLAERYHFERFGTDYFEMLNDKELDVVAITTPNNMHAPMIVQAARAGKTIFVEKPLCINEEELGEVVQVQRETGAKIVVGFNRRYAPLVGKLKEKMDRLEGPFLLNYRVNADYIPVSRWVQDSEVGGGRIIAECCHFFDLFNYLLRSRNPNVQVTSTSVNAASTVTRDNLVAVLKYPNGSLATLTYSALGNRSMDRERLEVFGQGMAFVLDDFKTLTIHERSRSKVIRLGKTDKGHRIEISELERLVKGASSSLITFEDAVASTKTTFLAEKAVRSPFDLNGAPQ